MIRVLRLALLPFSSALISAAQCGLSDRTASATPGQTPPSRAVGIASPDAPVERRGAIAQCALLPVDIQRMVGPVDGSAWMAKSISDTSFWRGPNDGTGACMIRLAPRNGVPAGSILAFEAIQDGAIAFETGAAEMNRSGKNLLNLIGAKTADGAQHGIDGWDYLGAYPREMTGRVGALAIHADWGGVAVSLDSIERIITMMRDQLPDYPGGAQGRGSEARDEDPCSLVTREEAEAILGTLLVRPYQSRDLTGLVDETGTGCSYYTKNHHVLSLMPMWSHGKAVFNVTGATRPIPSSIVGAWDRAASDPAGTFYFLKGDQMLAVSWRTSSTDENGAVKIAAVAMRNLSK